MKEDWRRRCTLANITTTMSINACKAERKRLKRLHKFALRQDSDSITSEALLNLNAIIKGKQFMFHTKYQFMKIKGRPFTWQSFAKHHKSKQG